MKFPSRTAAAILAVSSVPAWAVSPVLEDAEEPVIIERLREAERFQKSNSATIHLPFQELEMAFEAQGLAKPEAEQRAGEFALKKSDHLLNVYRAATSPMRQMIRDYAVLLLKEGAGKGDHLSRVLLGEMAKHGDPATAKKAAQVLESIEMPNGAMPMLPASLLAGLRLQALSAMGVVINAINLPNAGLSCSDLDCARSLLPIQPIPTGSH